MDTVVGLIPDEAHVTEARHKLKAAGFAENNMSVLRTPAEVWNELDNHKQGQVVFKDAVIGALFGLALGLILGVTAGILNCSLMNCPIERSLVFLAFIVLFCVTGGGLFGVIVGLDQREHSLYSYLEGVLRGQALFVVKTSEERASDAMRILENEQGIFIEDIHEEMG